VGFSSRRSPTTTLLCVFTVKRDARYNVSADRIIHELAHLGTIQRVFIEQELPMDSIMNNQHQDERTR